MYYFFILEFERKTRGDSNAPPGQKGAARERHGRRVPLAAQTFRPAPLSSAGPNATLRRSLARAVGSWPGGMHIDICGDIYCFIHHSLSSWGNEFEASGPQAEDS